MFARLLGYCMLHCAVLVTRLSLPLQAISAQTCLDKQALVCLFDSYVMQGMLQA